MIWKKMRITVFSYFFISFVLDGLQRLSGLFVLDLLQSTNVSRQDAVVPFIFSWVVSNIVASFSVILIDNKKSEYVIFFGVLLCAMGTALCILAANITTLFVCWGLLFGFGYGLASPHLSKHLKNRNPSKLSFILQSTPSLGVTIMPFVFNMLTSHYALQGSYLIFCGIILNYFPIALASAYNIQIFIPNIKWRVRKKSSHYLVSKQEEDKNVSIENFMNSLEPDLILTIDQTDESQDEVPGLKSDFSTNLVAIPTGRKRSETRGRDLKGLETDIKLFPRSRISSEIVNEIKNFESKIILFEESVIVQDKMKQTELETDSNVNWDIYNIKALEEKFMNTELKSDLNLKTKALDKISEYELNEHAIENEALQNSYENSSEHKIDLKYSCELPENQVLQDSDKNPKDGTHQISEKYDSEKEMSAQTEQNGNQHHQIDKKYESGKENALKVQHEENSNHSLNKVETTKSVAKENLKLLPDLENQITFKLPLDIKIHVEECTFTTAEEYWAENFNSKYLKAGKNMNKNSVLLDMHKRIDLASQHISKEISKYSMLRKPKLSNIYSISGSSKFNEKRIFSEEKKYKEEISSNQTKVKGIIKLIEQMTSRAWLSILLISIIFEINLITLLTMFADFGSDVDNTSSDFKWILVAFGFGGFIGKICCCKISRTIPEKYHAIGVVLFLLNGLATAGVLYSPNLNWLAGFYCILGALEGGITYIIPKFISEYIDRDISSTLFSVKCFLSGLVIICVPNAIGLFRDEMGDYEFLLQILSCSSILCAFLAYFLSYFRSAHHKKNNSSLRSKIEAT